MFGMFDFYDTQGTYEQRKVENTVIGETTIDTAAVTDSSKPYETGIEDPNYNNGKWVIVELYDTKEEALIGHNKWVDLFKTNPPKQLKDVSTATIVNTIKALGGEVNKTYKRTKNDTKINKNKSI